MCPRNKTVKQNIRFFKPSPRTAFMALTCLAVALFGAEQPPSPPRVLINQYCVGCHNQKVKTAGVSLQALDPANVSQDAAIWEKVLRKVSAGQMPPTGLPHPQVAASEFFTRWLGEELDHAAAAHPNPGR